MAIESAELSFIRCTSCRSLVSALSKTCRVCGAPIAVRQASVPTEGPIAEEQMAVQAEGEESSSRLAQDETSFDQEELNAEEELFAAEESDEIPSAESRQSTAEMSVDDPLAAFVREVPEPESHASSAPTPVAFAKRSPPVSRVAEVEAFEEEEEDPFEKAPPVQSKRTPPSVVPPKKTVPASAPVAKVAPLAKPAPPKSATEKSFPDSAQGSERQLRGWLVDFSLPGGVGIELREGRFFVTSQRFKELDLVFDHETISAPHAIVSVSPRGGVRVQDLMSEYGVHVCRSEQDEFEAIVETTELNHGDRIRFGDHEFLVCLIK